MKNIPVFQILAVLFLQQLCIQVESTCYFPPEFQGEYKMQSANSDGSIQYSVIDITAVAIPIWGNCHRRIGNNFILMISYGGESCIRCLHLKLRSRNILQVHASSQETISKCYINEQSAVANCPSEDSLQNRATAEIILFKTKDMEGGHVQKEYCLIDGKYSVNYKIHDQSIKRECNGFASHVDSCPSGSTLNIHFRQCNFANNDLKVDCLGQWQGPNDEIYLALLDNGQVKDRTPQYRCALYKRDPQTGVVNMAIGKDSTCINDLHNATHGYETFVLMPKDEYSWPPEVIYSQCSFPDWMTGIWEHARVDSHTFTYTDHNTFTTHTIKCVGMLDSDDKYLVFSRTQCDEEQYNCMRIQKRSNNIMEFQLGKNFSRNKDVYDLCSDTNFQEDSWVTQGRLDRALEASCPISGEYTGLIPNTTEVCAKLWSDCRAPELMYYQVSDCVTDEIYEEREYRCLGHWREAELLYTYTQRQDVASETFECFVGSIISEKEDIYIKEAGEHCQRRVNPLQYGMKLIKQGLYSCIGGHVPTPRQDVTTYVRPTISPTIRSTKPWNIAGPDPTIPDVDNNNINRGVSTVSLCKFAIIATVIVIYL